MGEAIAVDGSGSPPSMQIIFSAIGKEKEGDYIVSPEEGECLQDTAAKRPVELPPPLCKPIKIYPTFSDLRRQPHLRLCLPEHCLRLKKIGRIFLSKRSFKTEPAPCRKPPWGASPKKRKKEKEKRKTKKRKRKKNNCNKKDFTNKNVSILARWGNFVGNVLLNRDKKPHALTPDSSRSSFWS